MPIRGTDHYAANAVRAYPLDDAASAVDDSGRALPPGILVDLTLRFPGTRGRRAALAGVTVTPRLVTLVLVATDVDGNTPLAALTLPRPVQPGRPYPLTALAPGVAGWVVLGPGSDEPYAGRFSNAAQGLLLARCAWPYHEPPVVSIGRRGAVASLSGTVTLVAGHDVALTVETVPIDRGAGPISTRAIVARLADSGNRDVLRLYAGPCGGRPESRDCGRPPLERIGPAVPDCDGNIDLRFLGVAVTPRDGGGGVLLDLDRGLAAACPPPRLPDATGRLPHTGEDGCRAGTLTSSGDACASAPASPCDLVYDDMQGLPASPEGRWASTEGTVVYNYVMGSWTVGLEATPTLTPYTGGAAQIVKVAEVDPAVPVSIDFYEPTCVIPAETAYDEAVEALVRPWPGTPSSGGVMVAFATTGETTSYFLALVNATARQLEIWKLDRAGLAPIADSLALVVAAPADGRPGWTPGGWFRIRVEVPFEADTEAHASVAATAWAILEDGPGDPVTVSTPYDLGVPPARMGLAAQGSRASVAYFRWERHGGP
jgi:hypothetical protein